MPRHGAADWLGHIFRESNKAADSAADIAASTGTPSLIRGQSADVSVDKITAARICFDGTAGKINHHPSIGVVIDISTIHQERWSNAFTASIPLIDGASSTQAELLAGSTAIKILKYWILNDKWPETSGMISPIQTSDMCFMHNEETNSSNKRPRT